jgi:hypothetical protein
MLSRRVTLNKLDGRPLRGNVELRRENEEWGKLAPSHDVGSEGILRKPPDY